MTLALDKDRIPATAFLLLLCTGAVTAGVWALLYTAGPLSASLISVSIAAIVSAFVARFQFRLPGSQELIPVANVFAFWGLFWFGLPAGIALGVIATVLTFLPMKRARQWLFSMSAC